MTQLQEKVLQNFAFLIENERTDTLRKIVEISNQAKKTSITKLVVSEEKLTAQLDDGRELSIPLEWFAKWGIKDVDANKLKNYEIWEGDEIYFPDIDEVLGIEKFIGGFDASCE